MRFETFPFGICDLSVFNHSPIWKNIKFQKSKRCVLKNGNGTRHEKWKLQFKNAGSTKKNCRMENLNMLEIKSQI